MTELYWITRFTAIHVFGIVTIVISGVVLFGCFVGYVESYNEDAKRFLKYIKQAIVPLIIGILLTIFVPTTEEALLIYGVGGTIDYIKANDKAKQLPDKIVDALDEWLEKQNKD